MKFVKSVKYVILQVLIWILVFIISGCTQLPDTVVKHENMGNTQGNIFNFGVLAYDESKLYYFEGIRETSILYKSDFNGKNKEELAAVYGCYLNIIDDWIYYMDGYDRKIYKIQTNGEDNQKVADLRILSFIIYDGDLYVISAEEGLPNQLWIMDYNGENQRLLNEEQVSQIFFYNNRIYYVGRENDVQCIMSMDMDGNDRKLISEERAGGSGINNFYIFEDNIYFFSLREFAKISITGENRESIREGFDFATYSPSVNINGSILYYADMHNRNFYIRDLKTGNEKRKWGKMYDLIYIVGDMMFYYDGNKLQRLKL